MTKKKFVIIEEPNKALLVIPSIWLNEDPNINNYMFPKNTTKPEDLLSLFDTPPKDKSRSEIKWKKHKYSSVCSEHDDYDEANEALNNLENERSSTAAISSVETSSIRTQRNRSTVRSLFEPITPLEKVITQTCTCSDQFSVIIGHLVDIKNNQDEMSKRIHNLEENDSIIKRKLERLTGVQQLYDTSFGHLEVPDSPDYASTGTPMATPTKSQTKSKKSPSKKFMPWRVKLGLTISNEEAFLITDNKLKADEKYLSAFRTFLKFTGNRGGNAYAKMKLIIPEIFDPEIVDYYNTNGQHNKKNITTTAIMNEIFAAIESQDLKSTRKEISEALSKAMKSLSGLRRTTLLKEKKLTARAEQEKHENQIQHDNSN